MEYVVVALSVVLSWACWYAIKVVFENRSLIAEYMAANRETYEYYELCCKLDEAYEGLVDDYNELLGYYGRAYRILEENNLLPKAAMHDDDKLTIDVTDIPEPMEDQT